MRGWDGNTRNVMWEDVEKRKKKWRDEIWTVG